MTLVPLLLAFSLLPTQVSPQTAELPAPTPSYAEAWDQVERAIRTRYYARQSRAAEMDRLLKEAAPAAKAATTEGEFTRVVNAMIQRFEDSHFHLATRDDQGFFLNEALVRRENPTPMPHIGAWFRSTPEGYAVEMVMNGMEAEKAGLKKGDVVVRVNEQPFSPVASLRARVNEEVRLQWRRGDRMMEGKARVNSGSAMRMFLDGSRNSTRVIERGGKKIGYFRLWTQANDDFRNALAAAVYGPLQNTDAFVLDLRDGFGGRPEGFADPFFRPESRIEWRTAPGQGMNQLFGYQRPLVVLINGGSRSAKEVLSHVLKRSGRATLVGSTTAGAVLGTFPQAIGNFGYLQVPTVEVFADGVRLEDNGVTPHVTVQPEFGADGADLTLERGIVEAVRKAGG